MPSKEIVISREAGVSAVIMACKMDSSVESFVIRALLAAGVADMSSTVKFRNAVKEKLTNVQIATILSCINND